MAASLDPNVRLRPSDKFLSFLADLAEDDLPKSLRGVTGESVLGLDDVRWIYRKMKGVRFHEAMAESELLLPQPEFAPRNPQLEARCKRLRAEAENREYERMTSDIDRRHEFREDEPISRQLAEINSYLLLVAQFVVSIAASFACGYLAPYYLYGVEETGARLLCGVILGFVVAVADLYFIIRFFLETEGVINLQEMAKKIS